MDDKQKKFEIPEEVHRAIVMMFINSLPDCNEKRNYELGAKGCDITNLVDKFQEATLKTAFSDAQLMILNELFDNFLQGLTLYAEQYGIDELIADEQEGKDNGKSNVD